MTLDAVACVACAQHCQAYHQHVHEPISFVKVMTKCNVYQQGNSLLTLPKAAVNVLKVFTDQTAILELPGGKMWPVRFGWNKRDKIYCFRTGWAGFARENKLKTGDVVFFEYVGEARFLCRLFKGESSEKLEVRDGSSRLEDDCRLVEVEEDDCRPVEVEDGDVEEEDHPLFLRRNFRRRPPLVRSLRLVREAAAAQAMEALRSCRAATQDCPSFVFSLRSVHLDVVEVDRKFGEKFLSQTATRMHLLDCNGKTWPVKWFGSKRSVLAAGWVDFVRHHELKTRDFCLFRLVSELNTLSVQFYRLADFGL